MPLVTVVTAAQNVADLLSATIESIQAQTFTDWNMVVVDDASTDATAAVVEKYASDDKRISLMRLDESRGSYGAANVAMLNADAKYLARIDGDDVATPNRLQVQLDVLAAHPDARACASAWKALLDSGLEERVRRVPSHSNSIIKWMMFFRSNLVHSTLVLETKLFEEIGGYGHERVAEDFRLWSALVRMNTLAISDEPLVHYRFRAGQVTAAPGSRSMPARARVTLDHIEQCTDQPWALNDALDLRFIGEENAPFSVERALSLMDRFDAAWQADDTLSAHDRSELARHSAMRRLRHLRHSLSRQPGQVAFAALRHGPSVAASVARAARDKGTPWP